MSTRIPHLLEPYLPLPASSLTLLTSVLGATTNWLLLRYLAQHLARQARSSGDDEDGDEDVVSGKRRGGDKAVVFVSFMRDYAFWKEGAARLVRFPFRDSSYVLYIMWLRLEKSGEVGNILKKRRV